MRIRILLQLGDDDGAAEAVAVFAKETEQPEDIGLSIAESKTLLAVIQKGLVAAQAAAWLE